MHDISSCRQLDGLDDRLGTRHGAAQASCHRHSWACQVWFPRPSRYNDTSGRHPMLSRELICSHDKKSGAVKLDLGRRIYTRTACWVRHLVYTFKRNSCTHFFSQIIKTIGIRHNKRMSAIISFWGPLVRQTAARGAKVSWVSEVSQLVTRSGSYSHRGMQSEPQQVIRLAGSSSNTQTSDPYNEKANQKRETGSQIPWFYEATKHASKSGADHVNSTKRIWGACWFWWQTKSDDCRSLRERKANALRQPAVDWNYTFKWSINATSYISAMSFSCTV